MNVSGVHTQSVKDSRGSTAWMTFTVEVGDTTRLAQVLAQVARVRRRAPRAAQVGAWRAATICRLHQARSSAG